MKLLSVFLSLLVLFIEMGIGALGRKIKILNRQSHDFEYYHALQAIQPPLRRRDLGGCL